MPLPTNGIAWPPAQLAPITAKHAEFDAWYAGDPVRLQAVYQYGTRTAVDHVAQRRGGVSGALARMWWGRPAKDLTRLDDDKLHVPLATDLCQASADLLYAEPPSFVSEDKRAQTELDNAAEAIVPVLAEGAEVGAALGDVYYRVTWDAAFADRSFVTAVHADAACPEFRWGCLVAVTFWWLLVDDGTTVVRHLERHELDSLGNGVVLHGLYEGTRDNLGRLVPLTEHPSTRGIVVDADGAAVGTRTKGLNVVHAPNQRPQRQWRTHPVGANLGRSDLSGLEPHFDKLDMVYSSWMRDIRLAKARLIVPGYMLETAGAGRGAWFDTDQDIYSTVNAPPREDGQSQITAQQFAIRVAEHMQTADQLVQNILRTAGYSQQTFGEGDDGAAITATEVTSKDRRSNMTRDRKIRAAKPALVELLTKKLAVDAALFSTGVSAGAEVAVEFVDTTQADPESLARTSETLFRAQAASAATRVKIMHPDWDEQAVADEAAALLAEFGASVPDPGGFRPGIDDGPPVPPSA